MGNISGFTCLALCLLLPFGVESNLFIVCLLFVLLGHDRPDTRNGEGAGCVPKRERCESNLGLTYFMVRLYNLFDMKL